MGVGFLFLNPYSIPEIRASCDEFSRFPRNVMTSQKQKWHACLSNGVITGQLFSFGRGVQWTSSGRAACSLHSLHQDCDPDGVTGEVCWRLYEGCNYGICMCDPRTHVFDDVTGRCVVGRWTFVTVSKLNDTSGRRGRTRQRVSCRHLVIRRNYELCQIRETVSALTITPRDVSSGVGGRYAVSRWMMSLHLRMQYGWIFISPTASFDYIADNDPRNALPSPQKRPRSINILCNVYVV